MTRFDQTHMGVSTNLLNNPKDTLGAIYKLSQNFQVIEVELEYGAKELLDENAASYDTTVRAIAEFQQLNNLALSVHAPYKGPLCNLAAEDEDARRLSCNRLRQAIAYCADIGGTKVTYHPGHINSLPIHRLTQNLRRSLDELVPEAEAQGVMMCLENMGAERSISIIFSPEQQIELCQQTGTRITLDIVHHASHFQAGDEFFQGFKDMLPYIGNIHIADTPVPRHIHLPLGEGNLPVDKILKFLNQENYQGNLIVEEAQGGFSGDVFIEQACKYREAIAAELAVAV